MKNIVQKWPGILQYPIDLKVPKRVTTAINALKPPTHGFQCQFDTELCQYCCITPSTLHKHLKSAHEWTQHARKGKSNAKSPRKEQLWEHVQCQRFFHGRQGSQYFVVEQSFNQESRVSQSQKLVPVWYQPSALVTQAWDAAKHKEAQFIAEGQANDVNPWLERTQ